MAGDVIPAVLDGAQVLGKAHANLCDVFGARSVKFSRPVYERVPGNASGAFCYNDANVLSIAGRSYAVVCGDNPNSSFGPAWIRGTGAFYVPNGFSEHLREQIERQ